MKKKLSISLIIVTTILIILTINSNILSQFSGMVSDRLFVRPSTPDERIVIVGIDDKALAQFGEFPWSREVIAEAIAYLNQDENNKPAVIGIDVLFTTESENDEKLINLSESYDNIVFSSYAEFGSEVVENVEDEFYVDTYEVLGFYPPFSELYESSLSGHVNAMKDSDGVLRHAIWNIELDNGELIPSFNQVIANEYAEINPVIGEIEQPPTDINWHWYVAQQATPGAYYDGVSVADLVNGTVSSDYFKDKIVLIGPYSPGLQDDYDTPISSTEKMFGVEYQANAISALLTGDMKYEITTTAEIAIVILLTIVSIVFFVRERFIYNLIYLLVICTAWVLLCITMYNIGYVLYVIYVPIFIAISFVLCTGLNYTVALLDRNRMARTFERYVAPEIVKEIMKDENKDLGLGGKLADVAVLFADIRGFTALSAKLPPETVVGIINKYLSVCSACIFDNNGTLDKYIGDCTMAFWGAPISNEDSAYMAVKAGLDITQKSKQISEMVKKEYGYDIDVGIGITFGPAVVGNIGCNTRMDYTVIGDTVNTAARLENVAPGGHIYIDKYIAMQINGKINYEKLNKNIKLKGKEDDFEIFVITE